MMSHGVFKTPFVKIIEGVAPSRFLRLVHSSRLRHGVLFQLEVRVLNRSSIFL